LDLYLPSGAGDKVDTSDIGGGIHNAGSRFWHKRLSCNMHEEHSLKVSLGSEADIRDASIVF
jgi:hypothetical protein